MGLLDDERSRDAVFLLELEVDEASALDTILIAQGC